MISAKARGALPSETGVYLFWGSEGLLYVGKAKNIRSRVASHFQSQKPWIGKVRHIDFLLLPSEEEALLAERELIAKKRPRYNIRLRDDRSYPMIAVSLDEEYPRIFLTREERVPGRLYFGPWTDSQRVRQLLSALPQIFPFRSCSGKEPGRGTSNPCLDYHIGLCGAPCVGKISQADYRRGIDRIVLFLEGQREEIERDEERAMKKAAEQKNYEQAAVHRDRLRAIRELRPRNGDWGDDCDALGAWVSGEEVSVCLLEVRGGNIIEQRNFILNCPEGTTEEEAVEEVLSSFPSSHTLLLPEKEKENKLLQIARRNARFHLLRDRKNRGSGTLSLANALSELQEALHIKRAPFRIEGYDIANIGEKNTVGSMVVFEGGRRKKNHYRAFNIKSQGKPDDYASLGEMIRRRVAGYKKMQDLSPHDPSWDESFASLPDLILIDGGRGQVSAARAEIQPFLDAGVAIVGLAKKEETLWGKDSQISLPSSSQGSMLLQRVRDEAHRKSNSAHRSLRQKDAFASPLDQIPGIGPQKRAALLRHFGSLDNISRSSPEEISSVPGVSKETAELILAELEKPGA